MTRYVALLRGVNVAGRTVAMAGLRAGFEALGYKDVRTYIQSGNVVFGASGSTAALSSAIERRLASDFGAGITVVLRTGAQMRRVVAGNPLGRAVEDTLHVTFLHGPPKAGTVRALEIEAFLPDTFRVAGREVYVHCPNGYGRTKINNTFFEKKLGVAATTRNFRTVRVLADMAS